MTLSRSRIALLAVAAVVTVALGFTYRDALRKGPVRVTEPPSAGPARPGPSPVALKDGTTRDLSAPSGKLLVVHFWATWCPPCEEELPGLVAWWNEAKADPRVELVAVSVDEEWGVVEGFLAKRGAAALPLALDPGKSAATAFGTEKFPETWFLSPDGEVLLHHAGPLDWGDPGSRGTVRALAERVLGPPGSAS